jgi:hypothetical protein
MFAGDFDIPFLNQEQFSLLHPSRELSIPHGIPAFLSMSTEQLHLSIGPIFE